MKAIWPKNASTRLMLTLELAVILPAAILVILSAKHLEEPQTSEALLQFLVSAQTSFLSLRYSPYGGGQARFGNPSILAYASTTGAIETLVKHWAAILGPRGIRVNAVAPGAIDTDILKRIGKPEDGADVIAFLASDKACWITGASRRWIKALGGG